MIEKDFTPENYDDCAHMTLNNYTFPIFLDTSDKPDYVVEFRPDPGFFLCDKEIEVQEQYHFEKEVDLLHLNFEYLPGGCIRSQNVISVDALTEFLQNNLMRKIKKEKNKILDMNILAPGIARDAVRSCQNYLT